ncbi:MAG: hypothetical protein KatS3mg096_510 [Candidatus Parcubacteria bacterium]|nr:MAG: hypothetical protein KatS3mg093_440 [Candidatus Parcubacteria bacterium]GIW67642.1 MAG: hypothetical protein KatS3mg096_510 [Candidatus Parcubacteria bacterium]
MINKIEVLGEVIIKLLERKKWNLIDYLLERIRAEGNFFILFQLKDYLFRKNIQLLGYQPAKLFLAFDFDEKRIEKLIEEKFGFKIRFEEKVIDKNLILGGRIKSDDFLIDFSLRNLILKIFK